MQNNAINAKVLTATEDATGQDTPATVDGFVLRLHHSVLQVIFN